MSLRYRNSRRYKIKIGQVRSDKQCDQIWQNFATLSIVFFRVNLLFGNFCGKNFSDIKQILIVENGQILKKCWHDWKHIDEFLP